MLLAFSLLGCRSPGHGGLGPGEASDDSGAPVRGSTDSSVDPGPDSGRDSGTGTARDSGDTGGPGPIIPPGLAGLAALGVHNVVLVHVDTLRADHLSYYGYERETLPQLQDLSWLVVDGDYATASWTLPSTTSMLTALTVQHHGVTHVQADGNVNAAVTAVTLAEHLSAHGIATLMVAGNQALPEVDGVFEGFDHVDTVASNPSMTPNVAGLVRDAFEWIDALPPDQPFFAVLQPMDVHAPYHPQEIYRGTWSDPAQLPFSLDATEAEQVAALQAAWEAAVTEEERDAITAQLRDIYDEDVLGIDAGVRELIDGLEQRGLDRSTLVVLSADHGETLGDDELYYGFGHGGKVRQELVKVPLLFHHPALPAGTVDCLAQNTDLGPTLLAALGIEAMDGVDGHALQEGCRQLVNASAFVNDTDENLPNELLTSNGRSSLRWDCRAGLTYRYDLTADPGGLVDVPAESFPDLPQLQAGMDIFLSQLEMDLGVAGCPVTP